MPEEEIEHLYRTFSRHRKPARLEGCPCCTSPEAARPLLSKPLRAITADDLENYARKAMTTWGNESDYLYFLPRILELSDESVFFCDLEITFGKIMMAGFKDWPAKEQNAVRDFISAKLEDTVQATDPDVELTDSILCSASLLLEDITPLLNKLDTIAPQFKFTYAMRCGNLVKRELINNFWSTSNPNYPRVITWMYGAPQATLKTS